MWEAIRSANGRFFYEPTFRVMLVFVITLITTAGVLFGTVNVFVARGGGDASIPVLISWGWVVSLGLFWPTYSKYLAVRMITINKNPLVNYGKLHGFTEHTVIPLRELTSWPFNEKPLGNTEVKVALPTTLLMMALAVFLAPVIPLAAIFSVKAVTYIISAVGVSGLVITIMGLAAAYLGAIFVMKEK